MESSASPTSTSGWFSASRAIGSADQTQIHDTSSSQRIQSSVPNIPPHSSTWVKAGKSFIAGGISGSIAKSAIAPLDRAKILFQISKRAFSLSAASIELRKIASEEGVRALWRGNSATVARVYPYSGIQLMAFDQFKRLILTVRRPHSTRLRKREKFACGAVAGAVSVVVTYPLDLMRAKLAVQRGRVRQYTGMADAFSQIVQQHGVRGLYRGLSPTLLGILPYAGTSFFTYHQLQQIISDRTGHTPSTLEKLGCGAVAGLLGQSLTYPLDIVRRRMQTGVYPSTNSQDPNVRRNHHNILRILRTVLKDEGLRAGLFKGLSMNWIKGPISVSISFTTFDMLKKWMDIDRE